MRKRERFVIWPAYFDSKRTRGEGRRVPMQLSVPDPSLEEIRKAAERLGLKASIEEATHPRASWQRTGVIFVPRGNNPKLEILKRMGKELMELRKEAGGRVRA